jgi:hypothetical protein
MKTSNPFVIIHHGDTEKTRIRVYVGAKMTKFVGYGSVRLPSSDRAPSHTHQTFMS